MDEQFRQLVDNSKSILVLLPTRPFFDQVAAGLALFLALRNDKDVQIVAPNPMTVDFNRIIGINKITQELGNKNLVIRFLDYKPDDIERIKYDLDQGQMFLTIIPKPSVKAPAKDQVQMSYAGIAADTVFLIGGANDSHFPALTNNDLASAKLIHIGTKDIQLSGGKHPISLSRPASSISELIFHILIHNEFEIDQDVASNLLMGIEAGTNNFSDSSANADTFAAISELMKKGARRFAAHAPITADNFPPGSIPGMPQMQNPSTGSGFVKQQMPQGQIQGGFPQMQRSQAGQQLQQAMPYPLPQIHGGFTGATQAPRPLYPQPGQPQPRFQMPPVQPMQQQTPPQRSQNARPAPQDETQENVADDQFDNPPSEWLAKPKVYKGTSVS